MARGQLTKELIDNAGNVADKVADWLRKDKEAQQEAVIRLGLGPDNTASDRAKAMGIDIDSPEYHTTDLEGRLGIEADGFKNYDTAAKTFYI
jgi:hypothetical protein